MTDTIVRLPNNWSPREYQRPLWEALKAGKKRAIGVWHRRAGKDDVCLHWAARSAHTRVGNYWHMLPEASQARKAIWEAVNPHTGKRRIDEAFPRELRETTREQEMMIRFKIGSTWQVIGSDNYDSLVGSPPVGVVFSEWALADPQAWAYIRPILAENGGWALFIYTPRGRNHGATFFEGAKDDPNWFVQRLSAYETSVFTTEQLDQERKEYHREYGRDDGDSRFRQEYLCDFDAAVVGSYYGSLMNDAEEEGRICSVPHDSAVRVETWWDLGVSDSTAIWFVQRLPGGEMHAIDFYETNAQPVAHYAQVLDEKARKNGYLYSDHVLPHDAGGKSKQTNQTYQEALKKLGHEGKVQQVHSVQEGIEQVRQILPKVWFDADKCERGIDALRNYRREWDEKRKVFKNSPLHDWASHPADAFRYGAMHRPSSKRERRVMHPQIAIV